VRRGAVLLAITAAIYVAVCGTLYATQRSLLYYPTPESYSVHARELRIATDGAVVKVWELRDEGDKAVIYFGGNSEDVAANIDDFAAAFPNASVYLVNYRGYGESEGKPGEKAADEARLSVLDPQDAGDVSRQERRDLDRVLRRPDVPVLADRAELRHDLQRDVARGVDLRRQLQVDADVPVLERGRGREGVPRPRAGRGERGHRYRDLRADPEARLLPFGRPEPRRGED